MIYQPKINSACVYIRRVPILLNIIREGTLRDVRTGEATFLVVVPGCHVTMIGLHYD